LNKLSILSEQCDWSGMRKIDTGFPVQSSKQFA
jgi:hypothetical protein